MATGGDNCDGSAFNSSQRRVVPITFGPTTASGTSTASGATSLTDTNSSFTVDAFIGLTVYSNGSSGVVTTNSATVITVGSWTGGTPTAIKPYMVAAAGVNGPMNGTTTLGTISSSGIVLVRDIVIVGTTTVTAVSTGGRASFGVTGNTTLFVNSATDVSTLTAGKFMNATGGVATAGLALPAGHKDVVINANVLLTSSGTENITGGAITTIIYWDPISSGATLS